MGGTSYQIITLRNSSPLSLTVEYLAYTQGAEGQHLQWVLWWL
jgi:hypothetical protein